MNPNLIKILVALFTTSIITFVIYRSIASTEKTGDIEDAKNLFIQRIEKGIANLKQLPNDTFNKEVYLKLKYYITDDFNNSHFSESASDNLKWKDNLSKTLYAAYSNKFIEQAKRVLSQAEWQQKNLEYINNESNDLIQSEFLERGSTIDNELRNINNAIDKFYEIKRFIASCNSFIYSKTELSSRFPIDQVKSKISRANQYRNNSLENSLTNNCKSLHEGLNKIPQKLLNIHVNYLNNKMYSLGYTYNTYDSYRDFADNLYNPIKKEIEEIDNNIYKFDVSNSRKSLLKRWEEVDIIANEEL